MGRRASLLLTLVVALGLNGPDTLLASPFLGGTSSARLAVPAVKSAAKGDPSGASAPAKRTRDPKKNRTQKNKKDRRPDRKTHDRAHNRRDTGAGQKASVKDHYIVVLEPSTADPERTADALAAASTGVEPTEVYDHVFNGFAAVIPDDQLDEVLADPRVLEVVPDQEVHAFDSGQTLPTGIDRIDADRNSTAGINQSDEPVDVDVAVIDTGIAPHPELTVAGGVSCVPGNPSYADDNGHGTHVAGTIGARDNDAGVVGVAPGARLWAVKVLDANGNGSWSSVICGLDWVAARSETIEVVNMSLGGDGSDGKCSRRHPLHAAICRVVKAGIPVVVAAGNESDKTAKYVPAAYNQVITVSALADSDGKPGGLGASTHSEPDDTLASFSNFGADVDIAAPGVDIRSTWLGGAYRFLSGTSMASPHVAGAAALYLVDHPGASPEQVKAALRASREQIALPNDPDGIDEGVLYVGDDPPPSVASIPPPAGDGARLR
jgi:subtilisin